MKYVYYPGCSLEGTAKEYDLSVRALMTRVDVDLMEPADWTCCGASAARATSLLLSQALPARNLALAESLDPSADILIPCSACYLNLKETSGIRDTETRARINTVLAEDGLQWQGTGRPRHLLDILTTDIGAEMLHDERKRPLADLVIAPYYGCQCLRPHVVFDDPETPTSMEPLIRAMGATVHDWDAGGKCCGAAHMNTKSEVGMALVGALLQAARGADAIVTVCPMCQMNLEAYQERISRSWGKDLGISVLYLPQLIGLSMGLSPRDLGLHLNLALTAGFCRKARVNL